MRGETPHFDIVKHSEIISIHSPHARGDASSANVSRILSISIHSPHARGDLGQLPPRDDVQDFNPLPSCEGRRWLLMRLRLYVGNFNPLPSCEGRQKRVPDGLGGFDFNPLPSCEGRR